LNIEHAGQVNFLRGHENLHGFSLGGSLALVLGRTFQTKKIVTVSIDALLFPVGMFRLVTNLWTLPAILVGLLFVALTFIGNGRVSIVAGVLVSRFLRACVLVPGGASATALGHIVLGRDPDRLDRRRDHKRVPVQ
jgi:hypothetical protein